MKTHRLKILPEFFEAVRDGRKRFECRKNDRNFAVGDELVLMEAVAPGCNTGRLVYTHVTFVLDGGQFGIDPEWCVLGIGYPEWKREGVEVAE
jgi:hypothetical protein